MLPFFSDPYPDELLYSACARYHLWCGSASCKETLKCLFGSDSIIPSFEFGARLSYMASRLGGSYTADELLNNYTIFRYYRPFLPIQRTAEIERQLYESTGSGVYAKTGISAGGICKKQGIAYCAQCVSEDKIYLGEQYIHRIHQLEGILVCPKHGSLLKAIPFDMSRVLFTPLSLQIIRPYLLPQSYTELHPWLLMLAKSAKYLLDNDLKQANKESVTRRYKELLYNKGLASATGRVYQKDYISDLMAYYPPELLEKLESSIDPEDEYAWPRVMVRNIKRTVHPIRHLLLINYLTNVDTFFNGMQTKQNVIIKTVPVIPKGGELLNNYKRSVITAIAANPMLSRNEIRKICQKEYAYIRRRDQAWLDSTLPLPQRSNGGRRRIDWTTRDTDCLVLLKKACSELRNDGKRITSSSVSAKAGIQPMIQNYGKMLPQCMEYIKYVSQTVEEYQIERCMRIIAVYRNKGEPLSEWRLQKLAGLRKTAYIRIKPKLLALQERSYSCYETGSI